MRWSFTAAAGVIMKQSAEPAGRPSTKGAGKAPTPSPRSDLIIRAGQFVQLLIPSTPRRSGGRANGSSASTEWPGVVPAEDVELGNSDALAASHPYVAAQIRSFPVPAS